MSGDHAVDHINARLDALEASSPRRAQAANSSGEAPCAAHNVSTPSEPEVAACPNGFTLPAESKCPFKQHAAPPRATGPELNLRILKAKSHNNPTSYCYATEFAKCDLEALKQDLYQVMTTSQSWWPADYGHYGPLFVRMAWHSAGTYRVADGRGGANTGNQRFAPLNSWPDNGNLDKARRLLWPIKKKYGRKISWADLMIYAGNCAMEHMGCPQFGFAGGREDQWEPEEDIWWGPESQALADERHPDAEHPEKIMEPLGAVQMGLIYVNPEGPGGNPDVLASARDIRETFALMAMGDEETVALIAGGHTFGKAHGAGSDDHVAHEPEAAPIEQQGFGWKNSMGTGKGGDTITSGLEGSWTANPIQWDNGYFHNLFEYEYELVKGTGGAKQWAPKDGAAADVVPDAHDPSKKHAPMMFTTDLALRYDELYAPISKRFYENPDEFQLAYTKAWYKLCHRDMGPHSRCLGPLVPPAQIWQDPIPAAEFRLNENLVSLRRMHAGTSLLNCGLSAEQLIRTAWASACTYRKTDFRGGTNGGRLALAPQNNWAVNDPAELAHVLETLQRAGEGSGLSLADLVVLGGTLAIERAANAGGFRPKVPFSAGRGDATAETTDAASFAVLEPKSDGFRNYRSSVKQLVDRSHLLGLTAPEMAVLVAGMRVLNVNAGGSQMGVFTDTPGVLTNDFFVNLCDMSTTWHKSPECEHFYEGVDLATGAVKWRGTEVDLVFGSNSELRAIAEYYGEDDSREVFVTDFIAAWTKVMNNNFTCNVNDTVYTSDLI